MSAPKMFDMANATTTLTRLAARKKLNAALKNGTVRSTFPEWPCWSVDLLTVEPLSDVQANYVQQCLKDRVWADQDIAMCLTSADNIALVVKHHPDPACLLSLASEDGCVMLLNGMVAG